MISCQEECWFDCKVVSHEKVGGRIIANPECLLDCFANLPCAREVIEMYNKKGVCPNAITPATILLEEQGIKIWTQAPQTEAVCTFALKYEEFPTSDAADICGYFCGPTHQTWVDRLDKRAKMCGVKCTDGTIDTGGTIDTAQIIVR